jgi:hypothetical protein
LGDPHAGSCTASAEEVPDARLRACCNTGYARGACPRFPGGDAPDAVRFGIVQRANGVARVQYVVERDHYPFAHGILELAEDKRQAERDEPVVAQARAFLGSYLRRNLNGEA